MSLEELRGDAKAGRQAGVLERKYIPLNGFKIKGTLRTYGICVHMCVYMHGSVCACGRVMSKVMPVFSRLPPVILLLFFFQLNILG